MTDDAPPRPDWSYRPTGELGSIATTRPARARCDFCRMPLPTRSVVATVAGEEYRFCTTACANAANDTDRVFTEYHGFRRLRPGVAILDAALPEGMPRNSFVLLSAEAGTRDDALGAELIWRRLQRDEPAILVTFTEPPVSLLQRFLDLEWNVLPAVEAGRLRVVDCFTSRIDDRERFRRRLDEWNRHLDSIVRPRTDVVERPDDPNEIGNKIDNALEAQDMVDQGAVYLDSLTEFGSLVQPVQAYDFLKNIRADVCKGRFVPVFAGATRSGDSDEFPHDLGYVVDGIVDLHLTGSILEDVLLRRIRIRKMNGVLVITEWHTYEFTRQDGLVAFDPETELAAVEE